MATLGPGRSPAWTPGPGGISDAVTSATELGQHRRMSFLSQPGSSPTIAYAGRPMPVLAGLAGRPEGFACAEIMVPAGFAWPPPHAHDTFDEGLYVLDGTLLVSGDGEPFEAGPGALFVAPRGERHAFANPAASSARVVSIWGPA